MSFYTEADLQTFGFKQLGKNIRLSTKASIYNPSNISLGDNCRIDDFVVLSAGAGGIEIGKNVHIAVFSSLIGAGKITLSDFANISSRVSIYSSNDDYSGESMTNPTIPDSFKNVEHNDVSVGKHVIIGSGSVVLPGITLEVGVAIGALSLVNVSCEEWFVYTGTPIRKIKERKRTLLELERQYLESVNVDI